MVCSDSSPYATADCMCKVPREGAESSEVQVARYEALASVPTADAA